MTNVTRSPGTTVWMWSFFFMIIGAMILSIGAISYETAYTVENTASGVVHEDNNYYVQEGIDDLFWAPTRLTAPGAFAYIPSESLQYPTCRLVEGMEFESNSETALVDYTFLATVIYQAPETLQDPVDSWFGPGVGTIETDLVAEFRLNVSGGLAAVNYNVITMADNTQVEISEALPEPGSGSRMLRFGPQWLWFRCFNSSYPLAKSSIPFGTAS